MNLTTELNQVTMTSVEIATLTGKEHFNVMRDIKVMLEELGGAFKTEDTPFNSTYIHPQNGQTYPCFELPKRECLILVSGYNIKMRAAIIDRWSELETNLLSSSPREPSFPLKESRMHFQEAKFLAELFGLKGNAALISADNATKRLTGISPMEVLQITHLTKEVQSYDLTPTELGKQLSPTLSPQGVNKSLEKYGFQVKEGDNWKPTPQGELYSVLLDTNKRHKTGTMIAQLKWNSKIITPLQAYINRNQ